MILWGMLELPAGGSPGSGLSTLSSSAAHTGKLATPGTRDQVSGGGKLKVPPLISVSPVTCGYHLPGTVNGTQVSLLLDTGAAVTLLREDVRKGITPQPPPLKPWQGAMLVSADDTPLTIHGCSCVDLQLGGSRFDTEVVVVSPLTFEAIMGTDFLQQELTWAREDYA